MSAKPTVDQLELELQKISKYIYDAKMEIAAIAVSEDKTGNDKNIANAALHLNEVVRDTEEATNSIMDKADAIMAVAGGLPDAEAGQKLVELAVGILEACSFQDITGQRIRKVLGVFEQVELRVGRLVKILGGELPADVVIAPLETGTRRPDEDLLNGPQLAVNKSSQDDIDKLFGSN